MNSERKKGMICLTFEREADDRIICHDRNELIRLELNEGTKFENRECICSEEAFQFDEMCIRDRLLCFEENAALSKKYYALLCIYHVL